MGASLPASGPLTHDELVRGFQSIIPDRPACGHANVYDGDPAFQLVVSGAV